MLSVGDLARHGSDRGGWSHPLARLWVAAYLGILLSIELGDTALRRVQPALDGSVSESLIGRVGEAVDAPAARE